jgi:methylated-DNA-[protein]-cysteine S-methyltransferase
MEKLRFSIISVSWGYLALAASKHGLRHVVLPTPKKQQAFDQLGERVQEELIPDDNYALLRSVGQQLQGYFKGHAVEFKCKLDYNIATVFQREVWGITRTIPYGYTQHYGWVAERLGDPKACRAVGQALGANPLPLIIPCHRVVSIGSSLGGYSGGIELKSRLLKLEGTMLT